MTDGVHVYTANKQPAQNYVDNCGENTFTITLRPKQLVFCQCCRQLRIAKNAVVQVYYDGPMFWCDEGKGCKNPILIAKKKRREFLNRSRGQKRRWETEWG